VYGTVYRSVAVRNTAVYQKVAVNSKGRQIGLFRGIAVKLLCTRRNDVLPMNRNVSQ